jgi:DNA polymerase I-like protein with 3'-5' exonuclease and polymerase domains
MARDLTKRFKASPEIRILLKQAEATMRGRGYVISYLGRRCRLQSVDKAYVASNRLFQAGNADIVKQSMADIDDFYESETNDQVYLMNTVHDSIDVNVPEGMEEVALQGLRFMVQYGRNRRFFLRVPMAAEYSFGSSWGEATYLSESFTIGADATDESFFDPSPIKPTPETVHAR